MNTALLRRADTKTRDNGVANTNPSRVLGRPQPGFYDHYRLRISDRVSDSTPTSVYRYYDRAGLLLYVGITSRGTRRQAEHNADKEWWPFVTSQDVEHYPARAEAAAREKALIREFRPPFNKLHNPDFANLRALYLAAAACLDPKPRPTDTDMDPTLAFEQLGGKLPITQVQAGNEAVFAVASRFRGLLALAQPVGTERVLLLAPGKRGELTEVDLFADCPTLTFVNKRGGIPALRNAHLHLKRVNKTPLVVRIHEARAEAAK